MKIKGPDKTQTDETLNRLRMMPRPGDAEQTSSVHFGLIVPPSPFVMPYGWEWAQYAPFEGPSMIAGLLKGLGYKVTLLDQRETYDPEDLRNKIQNFDIIGMSTWGDSFNYLRAAAEVIKEERPDIPLVLGGPFISSHPHFIMKYVKADYAVVGEGELTLAEFMDYFTKNHYAKPIEKINGLVWRSPTGETVANTPREQIKDQDALPFQDFTVWDRFKDGVIPEIFMSYSRGCIANCTFCYRAFPKLNVRSVERVREEIEYYKQFKFRFSWWSDLTYITDKEYTSKLTKGAWTAHDFRSVIFSRVTGIDVPVLKELRDHGLDLVLYGMESVSKSTLADYHKGTSKNAIIDSIKINREAGTKIGGLFIIGAPTDSRESMDEMLDFCNEFKEVTRVKYLSALPGTANYKRFIKDGIIKDELLHMDWLSRERSVEEDIEEPGFVKFCDNLTKDELREYYRKINGVIEKRPYDYRNPINVYLPNSDAKFFKRPVYLENAYYPLESRRGIKIFDGDVRMRELKALETHSVEETKRLYDSMKKQNESARHHFKERSVQYNKSSNWVSDEQLMAYMVKIGQIKSTDVVLDVATGTGLVAKHFKQHAAKVIGLDISTDMSAQAKGHVDELIIASVESIPLADQSVDVCICRQGLQFVNLPKAMQEIRRVLKPGGRVVFCHLNAYGLYDRTDAFEIQALRNPARVNFFIPGDLESVMEEFGLTVKQVGQYRSRESVNQWICHGASTHDERESIKNIYRNSTPEFKKLHELEITQDDILDTMLFLTIGGERPLVEKSATDEPVREYAL